jgi:tmRNA-binding protein
MTKPSMTRAGLVAAAALAAAVAAGQAQAHHSFAMFDNTKDVVLEGVVREFQWTNPHSWVQLTVMENGKAVEYSIEGGSPNGLARRGWNRNSIKAGDKIKLTMHPLKNGEKGGSFMKAEFPDGRTLGEG